MIIQEPEIPIVAKQAFITRQQPLLNIMAEKYGRRANTLCVKVFFGNPLKERETLEDALWGDNHNPNNPNKVRLNCKLLVGTKIQNFLWYHDLSARVYAVFEAEYQGKRVACQLTDYLGTYQYDNLKVVTRLHDNELAYYGKTYSFSDVKNILDLDDVINEKVIDVQQYTFDEKIEQRVKDIYIEKARYGKVYYQDVPELNLQGGPRKSLDRINDLQLDLIEFKDKIVWDIGCAGGFFCRYALSKGAKIVYGFDEKDTCYAAFVVSNYLGAFNIDYIPFDLKRGIPRDIPKADIAFFLSMNLHIPISERLFEVQTVIFEDNGKESREESELGKSWTDHFSRYTFIGRAEDQGNCNKAIYHIYK